MSDRVERERQDGEAMADTPDKLATPCEIFLRLLCAHNNKEHKYKKNTAQAHTHNHTRRKGSRRTTTK